MTTTGELLVSLSGLLTGTALEHIGAIESGGGDVIYIGPVLSVTHTEQTASAERVGLVLSASSTTQVTASSHTSQTLTAVAITETREASHG